MGLSSLGGVCVCYGRQEEEGRKARSCALNAVYPALIPEQANNSNMAACTTTEGGGSSVLLGSDLLDFFRNSLCFCDGNSDCSPGSDSHG